MESLDLNLLTSLDALLQDGSVTGAARRVGLSTPAMSHALGRLRERIGDPILVRSGRGMVLTPHAEALKPRIHTLVTEARQALSPERPFSPAELSRTFVVLATDYVLCVLGVALDRVLGAESPGVTLRFVPNSPDDGAALRDGGADLAIGIYGELPPELKTRQLLTDRFVVVVRDDHPTIGKRLLLEQLVGTPHIQIAPRGLPGGYIDDVLHEKGLSRRVARAVPNFISALYLASKTDYLLTVSERVAREMAPSLGLRVLEAPIPLRPYALSLVWHPRFDGDASHRFLRDAFVRAAGSVARDSHAGARSRLDVTDPTSGQARRRPKHRRA